jgi:hypothetical protein
VAGQRRIFVHLEQVVINGFAYGVIFDQTECATIRRCQFENPRL